MGETNGNTSTNTKAHSDTYTELNVTESEGVQFSTTDSPNSESGDTSILVADVKILKNALETR